MSNSTSLTHSVEQSIQAKPWLYLFGGTMLICMVFMVVITCCCKALRCLTKVLWMVILIVLMMGCAVGVGTEAKLLW